MNLTLRVPAAYAERPLAAFQFLEGFRAQSFALGDTGMRHPFVAYQITLGPVARALEVLVDGLDRLLAEPTTALDHAHDALAEPTENLLRVLIEHLDACRTVVRAFELTFPDTVGSRAVDDYTRTIKHARDFTSRQINAIKHDQARVRAMGFYGFGEVALGYFIEGGTTHGGVGPARKVHGSTHTAFSYQRALRFWIATLVFCSRALASQLRGAAASVPSSGSEGLGFLAPLLRRLHAWPTLLFPDETGLVAPAVALKDGAIALAFPSTRRWWRHPPEHARISVSYRADGVTSSYSLPYLRDSPHARAR